MLPHQIPPNLLDPRSPHQQLRLESQPSLDATVGSALDTSESPLYLDSLRTRFELFLGVRFPSTIITDFLFLHKPVELLFFGEGDPAAEDALQNNFFLNFGGL
uniref:Sister chromatid cohesion protein PDS5 homolog A-B-like isoform X1 n=1 Tax=Rhizophora mucronata TaxID=61149 RepID=A0A2P2IWG7_RHIMU